MKITTKRLAARTQHMILPMVKPSLFLTIALSLPHVMHAQTAEATPATARSESVAKASSKGDDKDADAIHLSPFEIAAEKDTGFMAVNAGTATKLGLDLKDMPAAYSVMTREFIDAVGLTNLQDSSNWMTAGSIAATDGTPNDSTSTPNRVFTQQRGQLNQTGQQRDFFLNAGLGDLYSADRIDSGRGPNALFFNFGDINNPFAGGTSIQTKTARLNTPFRALTYNTGSWSKERVTVDVNQPVGDRLAVRANVLWQDYPGWRLGSIDDRKGATLTSTFRVTPNTEIKLTGSYDHFERTQTFANIFDQLGGWDGVTTTRGVIDNTMTGSRPSAGGAAIAGAAMANGKILSAGGEVQGINRYSSPQIVYIPGQGIMNWQNYGLTRPADNSAYTPVYYNGQTFSRNDLWMKNVAAGNFLSGQITPDNMLNLGSGAANGGTSLLYQPGLTTDMFNRAIAGSTALGGDFRGLPTNRYTVTPRKTPLNREDDRDINLSVTHKFSDSLFFSLAVDGNDVRSRLFNQGSANRMRYAYIDVNELLPNGSPNPHLGDVYSDDTTIAHRKYGIKNAGVRPSLNYLLDLKKWGYYTFNLGAAFTERTITDRQYLASLANVVDAREWAGPATTLKVREYWADPIMPTSVSELGTLSYFNNTFNSNNTLASSSTTTVTPRFTLNGGSDYHEESKGFAFATSGRYFHSDKLADDHLVVTVGIGLNNLQTYRKDMMNRSDLTSDWDGNQMIFKPDAPSDWKQLTYVTKNAAGVATSTTPILAVTRPRTSAALDAIGGLTPGLSQYANDRFRDDYNLPKRNETTKNFSTGFVYRPFNWIDGKVNYANSFVPPTVGVLDLDGLPAKVVQAYGYDARIGFTPFGDRFVLNSGWFYNYSRNNRAASPIESQVNGLYATRDYTDFNPGNGNSLGLPSLVHNTNFDYLTNISTGYEFEAVGRIMPGLEITGSYARFRTKSLDLYTQTPGYVAEHKADFVNLLQRAGGTLDANGFAIPNTSLGITDSNQLANQNNAINNYNTLWTNYQNAIVNKVGQGIYGPWGQTFNTFIRYQVQRGMLRGLRVGLGATWKSEVYLNGTSHANDVVANPNYDKTKAFNTNAGIIGPDGRYTFKNSDGSATNYNAPWVPDPTVNQLLTTVNQAKSPSLTNVILQLGYVQRIQTGGWFGGKEITYNLVINNLMNRQRIERVNYAERAPGADYLGNQNTRVAMPGTFAGYQQPLSLDFTVSLKL